MRLKMVEMIAPFTHLNINLAGGFPPLIGRVIPIWPMDEPKILQAHRRSLVPWCSMYPKRLAQFQKMGIGHDVFSTWMCHTQSHTVIVSITQVCAGVKLHAWFCHKRGWPWLTNIGGWYLWSLDCDDGMTIPHIDHVTWPWTRRKPRKRWKLRYGGDRLKPSMSLGFFYLGIPSYFFRQSHMLKLRCWWKLHTKTWLSHL